ncbi:hypothetical protein U9M48_037537, partial [Paspalum notatum var. saurae]
MPASSSSPPPPPPPASSSPGPRCASPLALPSPPSATGDRGSSFSTIDASFFPSPPAAPPKLLSLNVPKALFPLAGQPMVHHPISACHQIPNLVQIYLIGFYEEREFAFYVSSISNELRIPVRYLREDKPHGSAGGLYSFRDYIMEDSP